MQYTIRLENVCEFLSSLSPPWFQIRTLLFSNAACLIFSFSQSWLSLTSFLNDLTKLSLIYSILFIFRLYSLKKAIGIFSDTTLFNIYILVWIAIIYMSPIKRFFSVTWNQRKIILNSWICIFFMQGKGVLLWFQSALWPEHCNTPNHYCNFFNTLLQILSSIFMPIILLTKKYVTYSWCDHTSAMLQHRFNS